MMRSSSSLFWNVTWPCTTSSTTVAPSSGFAKRTTGGRPLAGARTLAVPAAAVVARLFLGELLAGAHRVEIFLAAIAVVGRAGLDHVRDHFFIAIETLRLVERPLVVLEPEPRHALEDHLHRLGRGTLEVRVFDAQDELALHAPGVQPAEQRRAHAADVQQAGGAGGETGDDGGHAAEFLRGRRFLGRES